MDLEQAKMFPSHDQRLLFFRQSAGTAAHLDCFVKLAILGLQLLDLNYQLLAQSGNILRVRRLPRSADQHFCLFQVHEKPSLHFMD